MVITGKQQQTVLHDERRNPHVIGWYGCSLGTELQEYPCVMVGGILICEENVYPWPVQEVQQNAFVLSRQPAAKESGSQFG
jgi:hypothetical protein